ncbi:conserved hypothetical protein [Arthrobacter sp. 9V]|uniref:hypothetical protein n=1 Tax=Arthrobacter sp. 9V TaxID=2653132 RepID=UPI0012F145E4|nr:hypothetical protein [Arthrobacter sp. 9V]VXC43218.1 conserved hypothetical protein [Arthrobacter sp. 9V]
MTGYVGQLESGQTLSAKPYFEGPWREFSRQTIPEGSDHTFDAVDGEYAIFIMSGEGKATVGSTTHAITPGSALTVGYRANVKISALSGDVEVFVTTLNV